MNLMQFLGMFGRQGTGNQGWNPFGWLQPQTNYAMAYDQQRRDASPPMFPGMNVNMPSPMQPMQMAGMKAEPAGYGMEAGPTMARPQTPWELAGEMHPGVSRRITGQVTSPRDGVTRNIYARGPTWGTHPGQTQEGYMGRMMGVPRISK